MPKVIKVVLIEHSTHVVLRGANHWLTFMPWLFNVTMKGSCGGVSYYVHTANILYVEVGDHIHCLQRYISLLCFNDVTIC